MVLGEKIARARKRCGLTQEQLAERLDVTRQSVSRWESGAAFPEMEKMVRLARLLGVSCDYLLRGEVEEQGRPAAGAPARLLESAVGRLAQLTTGEEDGASCRGVIRELDGAWARVEVFRGKKSEIRLLPVASILSVTFLPDGKAGGK